MLAIDTKANVPRRLTPCGCMLLYFVVANAFTPATRPRSCEETRGLRRVADATASSALPFDCCSKGARTKRTNTASVTFHVTYT